jgi:hypothetical protein
MSKEKKSKVTRIFTILLGTLLFTEGGSQAGPIGLWERHCDACHDGKTILNGKVVINKDQMKEKYKTLDSFVNACEGSASCMNILKHDKRLFMKVGKEIGISNKKE